MMTSSSISWSNRILMDSWISILVFLTIVPASSHGALSSKCPRDLDAQAGECFKDFGIHTISLKSSSQKLCCGMDVEQLRLYCHSYTRAIRCVDGLKKACPVDQHPVLDRVLTNLDGEVNSGITELCRDDKHFEMYAIYQGCFDDHSRQTESCFSRHLKQSSTIQFLSKVNTKHKEAFCSDMRSTMQCIKGVIGPACGTYAEEMVVLLVRPMVRDSLQCDYTVVNDDSKGPKTTDGQGPAYISDDSRHKSGTSGSKNSNKNQRRHKNRNSNSNSKNNQPSTRGANAGSHSGGNLGGGASGVRLTGIHCSRVLLGAVSVLLTIVLRRFMSM